MKKYILLVPFIVAAYTLLTPPVAFAHQVPSTIVLLSVHDTNVGAALKLPLSELGLAMNKNFLSTPEASVQANSQQIKTYLIDHIHPTTNRAAWTVKVDGLKVEQIDSETVGPYMDVTADVTLQPPTHVSTRVFSFNYDAIIKEVLSHVVFVSVTEDWSNGVINENETKQVGIIQVDSSNGSIPPLAINLSDGGIWKGFGSMVQLGMSHIRNGTDHLLFLFTLLLPAPLIALTRRWGKFGGTKRSLVNILKITTAFTIGHSLTLIISTLIHLNIPAWPIESLIAVSIIVSAIHAIRPRFAGKEVFIAAGFGLIHGMSFSFILAKLQLDPLQLVVSLLGFNVGIELMQLIIIAITMPCLILLATTRLYTPLRVGGALVALVAATGWLIERVGHPNIISAVANSLSTSAVWVIVGLAAMATAVLIKRRYYSAPVDTVPIQ